MATSIAIDTASGVERWRTSVSASGGAAHAPAISAGRVYVSSDGSWYTAVDAADGSIMWQFDLGDVGPGTAVVAGGVAYVGASFGEGSGTFRALDAQTGKELWRVDAALRQSHPSWMASLTPAVTGWACPHSTRRRVSRYGRFP